MKYREQLRDERWKRKRLKILSHADHRCQVCGIEGVELQVHHSYYKDGLMAWEYPDGSLIALCDDCHGRVIHGKIAKAEYQPDIAFGGRPSKWERIINDPTLLQLLLDNLDPVDGDTSGHGKNDLAKKFEITLANNGVDINISSAKRIIEELVERGYLAKLPSSGYIRKLTNGIRSA